MSLTDAGFMHLDKYDLRLQRNIGDAFAELIRKRWPFHTAKQLVRNYAFDPTAAANAVRGKAGAALITKAVHAEQSASQAAWELWMLLGEELIGETLEQYQERRLQRLIEENNRARERIETIRATRQRLEAKAPEMAGLADRPLAERERGTAGRSWSPSDGVGDEGLATPHKRGGGR